MQVLGGTPTNVTGSERTLVKKDPGNHVAGHGNRPATRDRPRQVTSGLDVFSELLELQ